MDEGKESEQKELNVSSAPVIEKFQLLDSRSRSSSGLRNEKDENSNVSDTPAAESVAELQLQTIPITSFLSQLGIENLEVTNEAGISAELIGKSLNEDCTVDLKMSDSKLIYKRNSTEIDRGCEKTGSSYALENVAFVDLTVTNSPPTLEDVTFDDFAIDFDGEQQNELHMTSSPLITRTFLGRHVAKSRHVPYSAKLSRHMHLRTLSIVNQKSMDHVSAHIDSHADLTTNEKRGTTDVTKILASASDQMSKGDGAEMDRKPCADPMRKFIPEKFEINANTCQNNEPKNMSLHIEVDRDFPLVHVDPINTSPVTETSICFENMSLHVADEDANLIRDDVSSKTGDGDVGPGGASIKLPGECSQQSGSAMNAVSSALCKNDTALNLSIENMSLHVSDEDANLIRDDVLLSETAGGGASVELPGECLRNMQQQSGSAINTILCENGSATSLSWSALHTDSVPCNTVVNMQQNSSAEHVHVAEGIHHEKTCDMTTRISNNMQHETCNSADSLKNMPLNISNDSMKNIQNIIVTSSSKNVELTCKSANASKDLQKENLIDVIVSCVQERINATDASESKGKKVSSTVALNKIEQKSSTAVSLSSSAQQSSNAVNASKSKERKIVVTTTAAKSLQPRNSYAAKSPENVQQNTNLATSNKMRETACNDGKLFVTIQQQNKSSASTCDIQQQSGSASSSVQRPKYIGSDFFKETPKEDACTKLHQTVEKQSEPVFKHPNILRSSAQGKNGNSFAQVPSGMIASSQDKKSFKKVEYNKSAPALLSVTNIQYQPLQDCQDLLELASCKTTDYCVWRGKPKHILDESSRANTFERFKNFQFSRATDNDVLELYGRLPLSLPEDLEEIPMCKEDIVDFTYKKKKVQDLEKVWHDQKP